MNNKNLIVGETDDGVVEAQEAIESFASFDEMELQETLLRGIYAYGFESPSIVQQQAIVPFSTGRDVLAQAQSGTGKTATFAIAGLQKVEVREKQTQVLILEPTRELAGQTFSVVQDLALYMSGLKVFCCTGGTRTSDDVLTLRRGVHVVVGTPGRVLDLIDRGALDVRSLKLVIIDEADMMLIKGFTEQLYNIFQAIPTSVQVGLFSATMPPEAIEVTKRLMTNPLYILVKKEQLTLQGIKQHYIFLERDEHKLETLCDLYNELNIYQSVIFCRTKRRVDWLTDTMRGRDFTVSSIHADMSHQERTVVMKAFRNGGTRVLITTDLMARGIDVQQVSVVINYDLPLDHENYIHRIGRSGRFGRKGLAISFLTDRDQSALRTLETYYSTEISPLPENITDLI
jgi:translation initiation factor 4A